LGRRSRNEGKTVWSLTYRSVKRPARRPKTSRGATGQIDLTTPTEILTFVNQLLDLRDRRKRRKRKK
jgi:hypothetical protein